MTRKLNKLQLIIGLWVILLFLSHKSSVFAKDAAFDFLIEDGVLKEFIYAENKIVTIWGIIKIPDGVTEIGPSVFMDYNFYNIEVPESVKIIGDYAFSGCRKMKNIDLSDSITHIGAYAFCQTGEHRVNMSDNLIYIGEGAFLDCDNLRELTISKNLKEIPKYAFKNCIFLEEVDMPENIISIGEAAFENCRNMAKLSISSNVSRIEYAAFRNCSYMKELIIPEGVTYIGKSAFEGCSGIKSVVIPQSVTYIDDSAFEGCSSLERVNIPDSVQYIGASAFKNCSSLEYVIVSKQMQSISESTFEGCTNLKNVYIPDSVWKIEKSAFNGCISLVDIPLFNNVSEVGALAFANCEGFTDITIPDFVRIIGDGAFSGCLNITKATISEGVEKLGELVFENCSELTTINIPSTVTSMGSRMFYGCNKLENVTICDGVRMLGGSAFQDCEGLKSITIPGSIERISPALFYGCVNLEKVIITDGVREIGSSAFLGCNSLKNMDMPESVKKIDDYAFYECRGLVNVGFSNNLKEIGNFSFEYCSNLLEINIPESVEKIGNFAFAFCTNLQHVNLNEGIREIRYSAFESCDSLVSVMIPESVIILKPGAFMSENLTDIFYPGTEDKWKELYYSTLRNIVPENVIVHIGCKTSIEECNHDGTIVTVAAISPKKTITGLTEGAYCSACKKVIKEQKIVPILEKDKPIMSNPFTDIPSGKWYTESVLYVNKRGAMTGTTTTTFSPNDNLTRGMTATLLWKLEGSTEYSINVFPDVKPSSWYGSAVAWAKSKGIVGGFTSGDKAGTFGPKENITRQDFVKILYQYADFKNYDTSVESNNSYLKVEDGSAISKYAREAMNWGYENGLIANGSIFKPKDYITRRETATIIERFLKKNDPKDDEETVCVGGHTVVIEPRCEATCTSYGFTEGEYCSVCNTVIKARNIIPKDKHILVDYLMDDPTCNTPGNHIYACAVCEKIVYRGSVPPSDEYHKWEPVYDENDLFVENRCKVCGIRSNPKTYINGDGEVTEKYHQPGCTAHDEADSSIGYYLYKESSETEMGIVIIYCCNCYGCLNVVPIPTIRSKEWQILVEIQNGQLAVLNDIRASVGISPARTSYTGTVFAYLIKQNYGTWKYGNGFGSGQVAYNDGIHYSEMWGKHKYFSSDGQSFHLSSGDYVLYNTYYVQNSAYDFDYSGERFRELNPNLLVNVKWEEYLHLHG